MAVQGFGPSDFVAVAKFAWEIYDNVRESRSNFGKLNIDVECLLVSIGSLDKGHTQELIGNYINEDEGHTRQVEIRALRDGLNSVVMPFYALFDKHTTTFRGPDDAKPLRPISRDPVAMYIEGPTTTSATPPRERPWRKWPVTGWVKRLSIAFELKNMEELRSRFAVQAANLNLFMTRLTHTQLQRQTELLTLRLAEQSLLTREKFKYGRDLDDASDEFRQNVAAYVKFLLDGGRAFTGGELYLRKSESQAIVVLGRESEESYEVRRKQEEYRRKLEDEDRDQWRREKEYERLQEMQRREDDDRKRVEVERVWERGREYEKARERERTDDDRLVATLDDDARLKLMAARQRLALAELSDTPSTEIVELDPTLAKPAPAPERPSILVTGRRKTDSDDKQQQQLRPKELTRRSSSTFVCDVCDCRIGPDKPLYRCESGMCGENGDTFDICRPCFLDGERCPGFDKGVCEEMVKAVTRSKRE